MFVKTLFLLILAMLAFAQPQPQKTGKKGGNDVSEDTGKDTGSDAGSDAGATANFDNLPNKIEFLKVIPHTPNNGGDKEGDIITIKVNVPSQEIIQQAQELVKSFTIAIGTGSATMVDDVFFMESEHFPYPTGNFEYKFQLPQQMENKEYCIVYTPYSTEDGNEKPIIGGVPMESLYESWFPIKGSLAEGAGPKTTVENTAVNDPVQAQSPQGNMVDGNSEGATSSREAPEGSNTSSSVTISPAITAFIAVLFACFFI